jgi:hypothetical protein
MKLPPLPTCNYGRDTFTSDQVVYYWIEHGVIRSRRINSGMPHWITLSAIDEQQLREWVRKSSRIQPVC